MSDTDGDIYIGFDFGVRRIGVAVGQSITGSAAPLTVLMARKGIPDWDELDDLLAEWCPCAFVVGLPFSLEGAEQPITRSAKRFIGRLKGRYSLPVHTIDETLTTVEAKTRVSEGFAPKRIRQGGEPLDGVAAQAILETWLFEHALTV